MSRATVLPSYVLHRLGGSLPVIHFYQTYPECGADCAEDLETVIKREGPDTIAAFIAEPIIGASAGAAVPPDEYAQRARQICSEYGVLVIDDEVMTGFGRIVAEVEHRGGFTHGFTYSHHPVTAAACLKTLEIIEDGNLLERAATLGPTLFDGLAA
jgi:adenosylmethionine-8-amino-7-oxononanoate aminotransferase